MGQVSEIPSAALRHSRLKENLKRKSAQSWKNCVPKREFLTINNALAKETEDSHRFSHKIIIAGIADIGREQIGWGVKLGRRMLPSVATVIQEGLLSSEGRNGEVRKEVRIKNLEISSHSWYTK